MKKVRVVVEFFEKNELPVMRWEHGSEGDDGGAYELLGRAFDVALREDPAPLPTALNAFLRGAMLSTQDVTDSLERL